MRNFSRCDMGKMETLHGKWENVQRNKKLFILQKAFWKKFIALYRYMSIKLVNYIDCAVRTDNFKTCMLYIRHFSNQLLSNCAAAISLFTFVSIAVICQIVRVQQLHRIIIVTVYVGQTDLNTNSSCELFRYSFDSKHTCSVLTIPRAFISEICRHICNRFSLCNFVSNQIETYALNWIDIVFVTDFIRCIFYLLPRFPV